MKHQILLKEIASMLQRQEMLTKLTESVCLEEYSYSETHCIDYIGKTELPNVTKIADNMQMTRGAISKMTKKLLAKGLIEKYSLESNKKEILAINDIDLSIEKKSNTFNHSQKAVIERPQVCYRLNCIPSKLIC